MQVQRVAVGNQQHHTQQQQPLNINTDRCVRLVFFHLCRASCQPIGSRPPQGVFRMLRQGFVAVLATYVAMHLYFKRSVWSVFADLARSVVAQICVPPRTATPAHAFRTASSSQVLPKPRPPHHRSRSAWHWPWRAETRRQHGIPAKEAAGRGQGCQVRDPQGT